MYEILFLGEIMTTTKLYQICSKVAEEHREEFDAFWGKVVTSLKKEGIKNLNSIGGISKDGQLAIGMMQGHLDSALSLYFRGEWWEEK